LAFAALRRWDAGTAKNVDHFAANSTTVRERIRRSYNRDAVVIPPPVDTEYYDLPEEPISRSGALAVSRFIPYKSVRLAIESCAAAQVPLTVAGKGPEESALRDLARDLGADVTFEIAPTDERLRDLYQSCAALVFPANEDFGIVPVEAQACGAPVVALDQGGALDTVLQNETGIRVARQDVASFAGAITEILRSPPSPATCRAHATRFSKDRFTEVIQTWMNQ
jgi:glycosyltransferase involved in cell wall biosynthesis